MFKFSAVSQIWKKYIQKLNDWDLPLIYVILVHLILNTSYLTNCLSLKNAKIIKRSSTGVFPWIASLWTTYNWIHKFIEMRRHQRKLDYKTIMDRPRTVSWIDSSYLPGEIKLGL